MDIYLTLQIVYDVVLIASCTYALRAGGGPERIGAAIMLLGSALTVIVWLIPGFSWATSRSGVIAVDLAVLAAFLALALRSDRFWPIWATAFHLIAVSTHLMVLAIPHRVIPAYIILQGFWAYPMLVALVCGAVWNRNGPRR